MSGTFTKEAYLAFSNTISKHVFSEFQEQREKFQARRIEAYKNKSDFDYGKIIAEADK
jgi:hypothetical protein